MADERIPDSVKHPLSLRADYADPHLWGGTAFLVGILGLVIGLGLLLLGNGTTGGILAGLGAILLVAGWLVARRGD